MNGLDTTRPADDERRAGIAVTVVAGLDRDATAMLTAGLLTRTEGAASIWVDPTTAPNGHVVRVVDDASGRHRTDLVDLVHDCVSCTVRDAVVAALTELRRRGDCRTAIVELHPGTPALHATEALCAVLSPDVAAIDTVVAVLAADRWLEDLAGDDDLTGRGLATVPGDDRAVAAVLGDQLDIADRIVLVGDADLTHVQRHEAAGALRALAPAARRIAPPTVLDAPARHLLATGAHDPRCLHPLADRGLLDWSRAAAATDGALGVVRWRSDRPLHPARLYEAVDPLADGVVRSAGRLWLAHAPDTAIRWDSWGGSLALGPSAPWSVTPTSRLAFLGYELDAAEVRARLDACRLTDAELRGAS